MPDEQKIEDNLVPGCVSKVWLVGSCDDGACTFSVAAESLLVQDVLQFICDFYSDAPSAEVIETEPRFITELGIDKQLSPTRRRALGKIRERILELAGQF